MYFYKTTDTPAGRALADALADLRREGLECETQAADFAASIGAENYVPAMGSEYGGVCAFVFDKDEAAKRLLDVNHMFVPVCDPNGQPILAENGTPYFELNYNLKEQAMRYGKASKFRVASNTIVSEGKIKFSAVVNMLSRTEIIKEATGRKPKRQNEYQILNGNGKFLYQRARKAAHDVSREAEEQWLETYSKLRTRADWMNMFPRGLTISEYYQLTKSREELTNAISALEDTDWSLVVTIVPGESIKSPEVVKEVIALARRIYYLPIIPFGSTHTLLLAALPEGEPYRPGTFRIGQTEYVQLREEAKEEGLMAITAQEYDEAVREAQGEEK